MYEKWIEQCQWLIDNIGIDGLELFISYPANTHNPLCCCKQLSFYLYKGKQGFGSVTIHFAPIDFNWATEETAAFIKKALAHGR